MAWNAYYKVSPSSNGRCLALNFHGTPPERIGALQIGLSHPAYNMAFFSGVYRVSRWPARLSPLQLYDPVPQQLTPLERDAQAGRAHRLLHRLPPAARVQPLLQ